MASVIVGMAMSLDGFVNDPRAIERTGAVVMGWNAFAMARNPDLYAGNYEFQVPIFVVTRRAPARKPRESGTLSFTFVTDGLESAVRQARAAAGAKNVTVIGGARP